MLFDTFGFWLFFAGAMISLAILRDRPARLWLVVLSYLFYAAWDWRFCLLLGGSTAANFLFGRLIAAREGRARVHAVTLAVVFNLVVLGFFKYFNFFVESFAAVFGLDAAGVALNVILPVGISFFTFEGIAYAVDVHRRELTVVESPIDFAIFISFFPHLVAGPIIRPKDFFPQLAGRAAIGPADSRWGLREILKGLIKKAALANYLAPIADAGFAGAELQGVLVPAWAGVLAFSFQIYFDFSGYTDIARGTARLLGFRFPPNFERPYLAGNIADFWRRWHISLSFWLRDYLYISLGGSRVSVSRTYLNLLTVMTLGGLWHGASWNFALWGLYHGVLLVGHRLWRRAVEASGVASVTDHAALRPVWVACTFAAVTVGWVPFRADDLEATTSILAGLASRPDFSIAGTLWGLWIIPLGALIWCLVDGGRRVQDWFVDRAALPVAAAAVTVALLLLAVFAQIDVDVPFVYFQF